VVVVLVGGGVLVKVGCCVVGLGDGARDDEVGSGEGDEVEILVSITDVGKEFVVVGTIQFAEVDTIPTGQGIVSVGVGKFIGLVRCAIAAPTNRATGPSLIIHLTSSRYLNGGCDCG